MVKQERRDNYIVLSDVHLGADLVQHARPWTVARLRRAARINRELGTMLDHYRVERDPEHPWCLVIAGDLVDFIGMSIAPVPADHLAALTEEELEHGLGSTREHAAAKMRAVAERHGGVFEKLARFVAEGNTLVLVRGNHDVDFHWEPARDAFVEALFSRIGVDTTTRETFAARIEFAPWFYYVENLLFIEHGHQYDATCSYLSPLAPVDPTDPTRIGWSMSDLLLRFVVRPTPGIPAEGHEHLNAIDYLRMSFRLGFGGAWRLFVRFVRVIAALVRGTRGYVESRTRSLRAEHERLVGELAQRSSITVERLRALARLHVAPTGSRVGDILRVLLVDRVGILVGLALGLGVDWLVFHRTLVQLCVAGGLVAVALTLYVLSRRARTIDPSSAMRERARTIARLFPARFIVMGHTHEPVHAPLDADSTYVNVGSWAFDDLDGPDARMLIPARTHLVIRRVEGGTKTTFVRWDPDGGPKALWERLHGVLTPADS